MLGVSAGGLIAGAWRARTAQAADNAPVWIAFAVAVAALWMLNLWTSWTLDGAAMHGRYVYTQRSFRLPRWWPSGFGRALAAYPRLTHFDPGADGPAYGCGQSRRIPFTSLCADVVGTPSLTSARVDADQHGLRAKHPPSILALVTWIGVPGGMHPVHIPVLRPSHRTVIEFSLGPVPDRRVRTDVCRARPMG